MTTDLTALAPKKRRNTKSWKSEARKFEAEAKFFRTQALDAATNWRRRLFWNRLGWWLMGSWVGSLAWQIIGC